MDMNKSKLVSVRMQPETLIKIDEIAANSNGFSRSAIINQLLANVLNCADSDTLWRIITAYLPHKSGFVISFRVDKDKLASLPHDD